ncbi:MAG: hypothetical protein IIB82_17775, partial [Bacteroidetes bacterium]|nr:hypothetical protein [Bacteroidota bacterium]
MQFFGGYGLEVYVDDDELFAMIGPNGADVIVGAGEITVGSAFALQITGGSVSIDSLSSVGPGGSTCTTGNFSGLVVNVNGAAVALTLTVIVVSGFHWDQVRKYVGIQPFSGKVLRVLGMSALIIGSLAVAIFVG